MEGGERDVGAGGESAEGLTSAEVGGEVDEGRWGGGRGEEEGAGETTAEGVGLLVAERGEVECVVTDGLGRELADVAEGLGVTEEEDALEGGGGYGEGGGR